MCRFSNCARPIVVDENSLTFSSVCLSDATMSTLSSINVSTGSSTRGRNIYKNAKITVKSGEDIILQKKKEKLAPGEMECIKLTKEMLSGAHALTFSLE